jgi:hypothetical protein
LKKLVTVIKNRSFPFQDVASAPHDWLGFLNDDDEDLGTDSLEDSESEGDHIPHVVDVGDVVGIAETNPTSSQATNEASQLLIRPPHHGAHAEDNVVFDEPVVGLQKAVSSKRYTAKALRSVGIQVRTNDDYNLSILALWVLTATERDAWTEAKNYWRFGGILVLKNVFYLENVDFPSSLILQCSSLTPSDRNYHCSSA